jgi:hypothetical protein
VAICCPIKDNRAGQTDAFVTSVVEGAMRRYADSELPMATPTAKCRVIVRGARHRGGVPRAATLLFRPADLAAELAIEPTVDRRELAGFRSEVLLATAAAGSRHRSTVRICCSGTPRGWPSPPGPHGRGASEGRPSSIPSRSPWCTPASRRCPRRYA